MSHNERTVWGIRNPFFKYSIPDWGRPKDWVKTKWKIKILDDIYEV